MSKFKVSLLTLLIVPQWAVAQLSSAVKPSSSELRSPVPLSALATRASAKKIRDRTRNGLPNIVLIGYWPPTNEMVREFSPHPEQNLHGWQGANWENRGYNIYSFFPEFPDGVGKGQGDFQVDYQNTSQDFWSIVPPFQPVAVLSFGRASHNRDWEIELITRNLTSWGGDFLAPFFPTPSPPDASLGADLWRTSRFPSDDIVRALKREAPSINPFADSDGAGAYLCEFLGYHLSWYRELNLRQAKFAAHTHIGSESALPDLKSALKVSLRALIESLDRRP